MTRRSVLLSVLGIAAYSLVSGPASAVPAMPRIFSPGSISPTAGVDCLAFMPDGRTVFFHQEPWSLGMIMVSHQVNGHWSTPVIAPFSGIWHDHDPAVVPDGPFVVFASNRPDETSGGALHSSHLWRVDRVADGWSASIRLQDTVNFGSHIFAPSVAANGDLYFQNSDNSSRQFHLHRSAWRGGRYRNLSSRT